MATMSKFPPDVPKDWDEAEDEVTKATSTLRAKASDLTDKATETVKDGYGRAKDAVAQAKDTISELDPVETAREGGEALIRAVERNPVIAFGLGAISVGLIAWASMRKPEPAAWWERYQPDYGRLRGLLDSVRNDAQKNGESAYKTGDAWLRSYGDQARGYADQARGYAEDGSRMIVHRARNEPVAALLGVGIAVYVLGSLLSGSSEPAPARRRTAKRA
jgi:ElaB/YqjD/DUF883 family membrane-anchored ribosome-binding protein